jgi:hypothetical protein
MSEEKKYYTNGVEYYIQFDNDDPIKLAESTEDLKDQESIERSTLHMEVGPWEGSEIKWKVGKKRFKIFSIQKDSQNL